MIEIKNLKKTDLENDKAKIYLHMHKGRPPQSDEELANFLLPENDGDKSFFKYTDSIENPDCIILKVADSFYKINKKESSSILISFLEEIKNLLKYFEAFK